MKWKGWAIVDKKGRPFLDPYTDYSLWIARTRDVAKREAEDLNISYRDDAPHKVVRVTVTEEGTQ